MNGEIVLLYFLENMALVQDLFLLHHKSLYIGLEFDSADTF